MPPPVREVITVQVAYFVTPISNEKYCFDKFLRRANVSGCIIIVNVLHKYKVEGVFSTNVSF